MKKILLAGLFILSACSVYHDGAVVRPEYLVNRSAEKISFPISDSQSVSSVVDWISVGDKPSSAEVACNGSSESCRQVKNILNRYKISYTEGAVSSSSEQSVSLIYARLTASACFLKQLGCSTSLNSVRMVANREQFVRPFISDMQDAETAVTAVNKVR